MATEFIVTEGPGKMDLMLALFDDKPGGRLRTVEFTVESSDHRILEARRDHPRRGGYKGLTREQEIEVEVYDQDVGPYVLSLHVISVEHRQKADDWRIVGKDMEDRRYNRVTILYSTRARKGSCKIEVAVHDEDGGIIGYE